MTTGTALGFSTGGNSERHIASKLEANMRYNKGTIVIVGGPAVPAGRALEINATAGGNVTFTKLDNTSETVSVGAGLTILPYAISAVTAGPAGTYRIMQ